MLEIQAETAAERVPNILPLLLTLALIASAIGYVLSQARFSPDPHPAGIIGYTAPSGESWVTAQGEPATSPVWQPAAPLAPVVPVEFPAPVSGLTAYVYTNDGSSWLNVFGENVSRAVGQISDPSSPLLVTTGGKGGAVAAGGVPLVVRWSPDGRFIAFGSLTGQPETLQVASADGASVTYALDEGYVGEAEWSPDGRYLAVSSYVAPKEGQREHWVYILDTRDGSFQRIFDGCHIRWSPDSRFIAAHRDPGGEQGVWIASADGTWRRQLTGEPGAFPLTWLSQ